MPLPTPAERLTEAQDAFHRLATGQSAVEVRDSNGESIRFTPANMSRLKTYIEDLKAEINGLTSAAHRRPLRPFFGR